jgi:hypothetical protein
MFKFIFTDTGKDVHARTIEFTIPDTDYTYNQVLSHFLDFLRGVGYQFPSNAQLVVGEDDVFYTVADDYNPQEGSSDKCCGSCRTNEDEK